MTAPARYATQVDPACRSYGPRIAAVSQALKEPLMPWQVQAAHAIAAVHPTDPTRWRYPLIVITVPRQSGKTTLLRATHTDRLLRPTPSLAPPRRPQTIWMTAQTGKDARRRWDDLAQQIAAAPALKEIITKRASIGSEALRFGPMRLSPFAPTPKAIHGETTSFVSVDEAWAFDELSAAALLAAITPAMQNEPGKQLIIVSTAGDRSSQWLWSLVKAGRASVADPHATMAYFEWSADPEAADLDPYSPDLLASFHPAIGHLITPDDVLALRDSAGSVDNWRRSFLNLWPDNMDSMERDLSAFDAAAAPDLTLPTDEAVYAYSVAHDRSAASIYAAWARPSGVHVALAETGPGAAWLPATVAKLAQTGRPIYADTVGYTQYVADILRLNHSTTTLDLTSADYAAASAAWLAGLTDRTLTHDNAPELRSQMTYAVTHPIAGGFGFDERRSPGPIDALKSAVIAAHAATRNSTPAIYC